MSRKRILVLGGGFAGLWSAVGAARKLDELKVGPDEVEVTLVNRDAYHNIRVRNYEADLTPARVPLDDVLIPIGVKRVTGEVSAIDVTGQTVTVDSEGTTQTLGYDRLVFALGSQLARPKIEGLSEFAFDVDTYTGAAKLETHLQKLAGFPDRPDRYTVLVVGAGLTGVETACEMPGRLRQIAARAQDETPIRVILADHKPWVGADMGEAARPVIETALEALRVETRLGVQVAAVDAGGVRLTSGETIAAATVIWCAGMRASPLTGLIPVERDRLGRLPVDGLLRVAGVQNVFAAGDSACLQVTPDHCSVMSCQHSRPMGRFAGHNAVCDLMGRPMLPLAIEWYVTVLDLGPWGALYTEGWDRHVVTQGSAAKKTKQVINGQRIYPPLTGDRQAILEAAAPTVQTPPRTDRH
jgi:NADH dehydrogenase